VAIGLLIAGELLDRFLFNNTENALQWFQIRKLILVGIASGLAALLTPHGFGTWQVAFATLGMKANDLISEWTSPDFHETSMLPFLLSVLLLLFSLGWSKKRLNGWELLTILWFTYFAFSARRQIGPYAITVLPILGRYLWEQMEEWGEKFKNWRQAHKQGNDMPGLQKLFTGKPQAPVKENKLINLLLVFMLALATAGKLVYVSNPVIVEQVFLPSLYPTKAVAWIEAHQPGGNLFNEYGQGGYLSWFLPDYPVYVDARADLYGDEFLLDWVDLVNGSGDWDETVKKWGVGIVLISSKSILSRTLEDSANWSVVLYDNDYMLFVRH